MNELIKINYDDYYKFLVSLGCIIFVISSALLYYLGSAHTLTWFVSIWLTIFLIISLVLFYLGISGWRKRQSDLDKLLSLDVRIKEKIENYLNLDISENVKKQFDSKNRLKNLKLQLKDITGPEK